MIVTALKKSDKVRRRHELFTIIISLIFQLLYCLLIKNSFEKAIINQEDNYLKNYLLGLDYTLINMIFASILRSWIRKLFIMTTGLALNLYYLSNFYGPSGNQAFSFLTIYLFMFIYCVISHRNDRILQSFLSQLNDKIEEEKQ